MSAAASCDRASYDAAVDRLDYMARELEEIWGRHLTLSVEYPRVAMFAEYRDEARRCAHGYANQSGTHCRPLLTSVP